MSQTSTQEMDVISESQKTFQGHLPNGVYDWLKWTTLILLPAFATLYYTLGMIWGFPNITEIVGSIAAVQTFLGVLLGLSTFSYNRSDANIDGDILIDRESQMASLIFNSDANALQHKSTVQFKVKK